MQEWIDITEALKIVSVSRPTLCKWCEDGRINSRKVISKTKQGWQWELERADCIRVEHQRKGPSVAPDPGTENIIAASIPTASPASETSASLHNAQSGSGKGVVSRELTRQEAERIIKVEDAIKKHRDNFLMEGKLLLADELISALHDFFSQAFDAQRELIDKLSIEWRMTPDQAQIAQIKFNHSLNSFFEKIKKKIDEQKCHAVPAGVGAEGRENPKILKNN